MPNLSLTFDVHKYDDRTGLTQWTKEVNFEIIFIFRLADVVVSVKVAERFHHTPLDLADCVFFKNLGQLFPEGFLTETQTPNSDY